MIETKDSYASNSNRITNTLNEAAGNVAATGFKLGYLQSAIASFFASHPEHFEEFMSQKLFEKKD